MPTVPPPTARARRRWWGRWLLWAGGGWLLYGLGYGLWSLLRLGVPGYDWQWYLALLLALLWLLALATGLRPRRAVTLGLGGALAAWLVIGYGGFGQALTLDPTQAPPVPLSFWAFSDYNTVPDAQLDELRAAGGRVYLDTAVPSIDTPEGQRWLAGLRRLEAHGVPVVLAVVASNFLSVPAQAEWQANMARAAAQVQSAGLTNIAGLLGDAERPVGYSLDVFGLDRAAFNAAAVDLAVFQSELRVRHPDARLGVTAHWAWFVDSLDGDPDLARVQRSPVDPPGGWDFVNVMTYSSYLPPADRAYYVVLIERALAQLRPAARPSHLLGLVGAGFPGEPLMPYAELVRDAQISRALGVPEVVVFQLSSALPVFGPNFVADLTAAVNAPPAGTLVRVPFSRLASGYVFLVCAADGMFDLFSGRAWLWLLWLGLSAVIAYRSGA